MFYEDLHHYIVHRMLHWPSLYKWIHKIHHENSAPYGLASEYAHPLETLFTGCGTVIGPVVYQSVILLFFNGNKAYSTHMITLLTWCALRIFQTIDAHSGYDFPWSVHNIIPFWAGAEHHDYHHMNRGANYASSFRWWDRIFGTDALFHAYRNEQKQARIKAKAL